MYGVSINDDFGTHGGTPSYYHSWEPKDSPEELVLEALMKAKEKIENTLYILNENLSLMDIEKFDFYG